MKYYSTRDKTTAVPFSVAALNGLAADGGLFIPQEIPQFAPAVKNSLGSMGFADIAFETIRPYVHEDIPDSVLGNMVESAFTFSAPLVPVHDRFMLELFHGPTAAFKDFGARFMARCFAYLRRNEDRELHILVATSGDTGGAVADGFYGVEGIRVTVLYPKGRVSPLQERQIAGLGGNVSAIAVEGSFDDCQRLVKSAFVHPELNRKMNLSSANSINISRLLPQAVYYVAASGLAKSGRYSEDGQATPRLRGKAEEQQVVRDGRLGKDVLFCVPSGNFGNLTAGLYAQAMGAPIAGFIAATNINKTVPAYLASGVYEPRSSVATISNAMDVGAPSNFERMTAHWSYEDLRATISGFWVDDDKTRLTIQRVFDQTGYVLDPHGAVGWNAVDQWIHTKTDPENHLHGFSGPVVVLGTAHPAKFAETVEPLVGSVPVPPSLAQAMERTVQSVTIRADVSALVETLLS
ncbi:pyridoxal-phosphate dependent enzyme [Gracilinema caldarium]|uniref:Threonine synthase n=1 Tax=Gracilinema caldarium (strain ATCC 51460 / DSM 7334 / H1) TaxID=744872 RepID=F8EYI0_GRAC1|nr:pyridoxal-phosphate dependent enzyme [Gracilinema caldarium]AEJ18412.1 threonine synthase [Gracilinema caldarium DSM 7334]